MTCTDMHAKCYPCRCEIARRREAMVRQAKVLNYPGVPVVGDGKEEDDGSNTFLFKPKIYGVKALMDDDIMRRESAQLLKLMIRNFPSRFFWALLDAGDSYRKSMKTAGNK